MIAPGFRARTTTYFCRAAKVGKNALEPTVQDSLDGHRRRRLPYTGVFTQIGWWLDSLGAPELATVLLGAWCLKNSG